MDKKVAEVRAEQWRQIIYNCLNRNPEISKRQWCRNNGIRYRSLMYWQHRFQMESLDLLEHHETSLPAKQDSASIPAFADMTSQLEALRAKPESFSARQEAVPLAPELMIQAGAFRIYVNSSIQESTLETVMRVIRHA